MAMIRYLLLHYGLMVGIFFLSRAVLFTVYFEKLQESDASIWLTFLYGLRMDTIAASYLLIIPSIVLAFSPQRLEKAVRKFLRFYFLIVLSIAIYVEVATFPFFAQYDVRPNYLFVEYLIYPKEVFATILADYKLELFVAFAAIGAFVFAYRRYVKDTLVVAVMQMPFLQRTGWFLAVAALLFIGIRSSFGHRPANISDAMYSSNRTLNEITKNSLYSVLYAVYVNKAFGSEKLIARYGKMPLDEAYKRVKSLLRIDSNDTQSPLRRLERTRFPRQKPKNLVIFVQESMGYQFVEAVGGEPGITPHFNRLAQEGILFTRLYSNGTRSVRGLAGLTSGIFSIPGEGVVKRNKAQSDFFTVASLLKPYGYYSMFIYGGESRFDNMKGWYLGNGFDRVIDEEKFENPKFVGTWGVCDGEVVERAHREFLRLYKQNRKFVTVIFSTSNHEPFDFPKEKIDPLPNVPLKSVKNAVKYADYAIGRLIELAKAGGYFDDTVFVIAADHNVRVYGKDMVPVDMFHIPGLILGGGITPQKFKRLATQPDVLATALDLIGLDLSYPIMGHSIFSDRKADIAFMQFHTAYALRKGERVAVIRPGKTPLTFRYANKRLYPSTHDEALERDALALIIVLNDMYQKRLYK